ncbi:SAM-dependent methyltransferase [Halobacillus salinarum]|uniref:SAM-dependent methyltransferase n=1 Tax=Halobacillus salinarum TaxID=2932257 RepID=A0ABY4EMN1_9BACI|nr:SAM-dependent methyltransferase [Halobacillus salinarum]UOQ44867.1 SAM-dependent methyltransferase [Halobacillus salinarum]
MNKTKLDLDKIIFIGRTYEEYIDMFALTEEHLQGKNILDCPAGACSFTAKAREQGISVTACDIAYDHSVEALEKKGQEDISHALVHMKKAESNYVWDYFHNLESLGDHRRTALEDCIRGMEVNRGHYLPVELPELPFHDQQFDLTLSAHFLFMYADRLDVEFHKQTLEELIRVTKEELRLFPLIDLEGHRYPHLDEIISFLHDQGCDVEEVNVGYEFQAGGNTMLKVRRL